jgi:hypothetical protein
VKAPADLDLNDLAKVAQAARLVLRFQREERVVAVKTCAGVHCSEEGSEVAMPLNLLSMYRTIVGRKLVANNPRALLTTDVREAKPVVAAMENWVNKQIQNINLVETLQRAVDDSLFCLGVVKVSLADPGMAANLGWAIRAGEPFAETIDLDDFVFDVHARRFDQCAFIGHRYRIPLKVAIKLYGKSRDLQATDDSLYNMDGDERISIIGKTTLAGYEELEPMIDLWEFYLPRHKLIITLRDDDMGGVGLNRGKALEIKPWLGPKKGPYHILSMGYLPGNPMPVAPIQNLIDLANSVNQMIRKLMDQAERQKTITVVAGSASKEGATLADTNDGGMMYADRIDSINEVGYGGPNQNNFQLMGAFKELFSWQAGNLDILGGLGPQSKTATQDEMMQQNSSATIADMQQRAVAHAASVVNALCWYYHHDPQKIMKLTYSLPGMPDVTTPLQVGPAQMSGQQAQPGMMYRNHDYEDMSIRVDPYSLQYKSPEQRMAALDQVVSQILIPIAPILQQQGVGIDFQAYLAMKAKLGDMPDLLELVKMAPPPQPTGDTAGEPQAPAMPQNTKREYVRRSEGGASNEGKAMASANAMSLEPTKNGQPNAIRRM